MKRKLAESHASCRQALKRGASNSTTFLFYQKQITIALDAPQWNIIKQKAANIKKHLILTARQKS